MKVIFAGGGTGGHIYPAIAVADELKSRSGDFEALFVGTRSGLESKVVREAGYAIKFIFSRGVRGRGVIGQAITLACMLVGMAQAVLILSRFKPDLVFGAGGYASAAVVATAFLLRKKIVMQEQNSIPGLTNRRLAFCASRIYLGFKTGERYLKDHPGIEVTGNPIRRAVIEKGENDPHAEFGLSTARPVLLVFGGSQGALNLNRAAVEYFLSHEDIQGIIQTGEAHYQWVNEKLKSLGGRVFVSAYLTRIYDAYRAADMALARAGAMSVSELAAVGLPALLVPYPHAADDHQVHNAAQLVECGGAIQIEDAKLNGRSLQEALDPIIRDPGRLERMSRALDSLGGKDAAAVIAADMERVAGTGSGGKTV
ncbi:MAG: undecaprenyldiphospho-muramoylpentapeptide beta-N-acetylglucosaminyltransferase [Candidatus Krumholzibacteriota bacterium]|nr:undecaprenyldiphospho-muramoylpentapeptide beta-N-acetylglucosaminyltransferase [Candidatus Krumholzibacteriota bacterium]